jgi:hypothetical protein
MSIGFLAHRLSRRPARVAARAAAVAAAAALETLEARQLFATFAATEDAFVREGAFANTNFGAAAALFTKNTAGDAREAYVKFDVSGSPTVGTAVLRVDAKTQAAATPDQRVAIYAASSTSWVEGNGTTTNDAGDGADTDNSPANEITFANRPAAAGAPLDIITVSGSQEQGYAFDVTRYVRAEKAAGHNTVAFVIRNLDAGTEYVSYVSREGGEFGPSLDVTTDAGPAATATVADIDPPTGATTDITVTYTDSDKVEILSISPDDVLVLGPDGQALNVTSAVATGTSSATSLAVTYTVAAPGGSWDAADVGTYSVRLAAGQVADVLENVAPPGVLATFNVGNPTPPVGEGPAATFAAGPVTGGAATHSFNVTYADANNVARASIGAGNVSVSGPAGTLAVTGITVSSDADGPSLVATYTVAAPGGAWDAADNGTYTVALLAEQVKDANGNSAAAGTLGTFTAAAVGEPGDRTRVGAFGSGTANPRGLTFTDADGTIISVTIKTGQGQVFLQEGAYGIDLTGTTGASALSIKTRGGDGRMRLGDSTATGGLRSINAKTADLVGAFDTGGSLGKATLGNVTGGSLVVGTGGQVALTVGDVTNFSIDSDSVIKSIKANLWSDDGAADLISAPDFGTLAVKGNFGADIDAASVKSLKVGGALVGASIRTAGNIGKVTAGGMSDSAILAGVNGAALPQSSAGFANAGAEIKGVTIKGTFSNSAVAAPTIGKLALGTVQPANNGTPLGVAADSVKSLTATAGGALRLSKLTDPSDSTTFQDFVVRIV